MSLIIIFLPCLFEIMMQQHGSPMRKTITKIRNHCSPDDLALKGAESFIHFYIHVSKTFKCNKNLFNGT